MFVLSLVDDLSTRDELIFATWVYEGCVRRGDVVTWCAELKVMNFGLKSDGSELDVRYKVSDLMPVGLTVRRIEKPPRRDWDFMERGYSGAFFYEVSPSKGNEILIRFRNREPGRSHDHQATREQPRASKNVCLFDSRATADTYLSALPPMRENL